MSIVVWINTQWHTFCIYKSHLGSTRAMSCSEKEGGEENLKLIALPRLIRRRRDVR